MVFENERGLNQPKEFTKANDDPHSPRWAFMLHRLPQSAGHLEVEDDGVGALK
jgi:hypothetical protein